MDTQRQSCTGKVAKSFNRTQSLLPEFIYISHHIVFVPLSRTTRYTFCAHCIAALLNDVEAAAWIMLFEKRSFAQTEHLKNI